MLTSGEAILYTARSLEFRTEEGMLKAVHTCLDNGIAGIAGIAAIGGDGTFRGARDLSQREIPCIRNTRHHRQRYWI